MKFLLLLPFLFYSYCTDSNATHMPDPKANPEPSSKPNAQKEKYWYNGEAELSSYKLSQARYGELHEGQAVLIFVTEPFSKEKMTKADNHSDDNISVLKLNFTKKFYTGIYPYSMMTSTFLPFKKPEHSLKISSSTQEWCGHSYMELQNKNQFEIEVKSYFENESGQHKLKKHLLEDDFWSKIRLDPDGLPEGNRLVIPSFFNLRLGHGKSGALDCTLTKGKIDDETSTYTIAYKKGERTLVIRYQTAFPHKIMGWEENLYSGFGSDRKKLTTTAELQETIKTDYWTKHSVADGHLRDALKLK